MKKVEEITEDRMKQKQKKIIMMIMIKIINGKVEENAYGEEGGSGKYRSKGRKEDREKEEGRRRKNQD